METKQAATITIWTAVDTTVRTVTAEITNHVTGVVVVLLKARRLAKVHNISTTVATHLRTIYATEPITLALVAVANMELVRVLLLAEIWVQR